MQHLLLINQNNPKKEFLEALLRGFLLRESFVILTIDRLSINFEFTIMSFHDLIGESSLFNRFWIVRSSRTMTKHDFMDRHY